MEDRKGVYAVSSLEDRKWNVCFCRNPLWPRKDENHLGCSDVYQSLKGTDKRRVAGLLGSIWGGRGMCCWLGSYQQELGR